MIGPSSVRARSNSARWFCDLTPSVAALAAAVVLAAGGAANACCSRYPAPPRANPYPQYDELPPHLRPCFSLDDCDRKAFDESGTRGRMGLGADPAHPEGPGNPSF